MAGLPGLKRKFRCWGSTIRELRLPMTRLYAVGDEPFSLESAIDKAADLCSRIGVAQDHCVLEFENQGASTKLAPETWTRGVRHSLQRGYGFHHWEIANEPYASLWGHGQAFACMSSRRFSGSRASTLPARRRQRLKGSR